MGRDEARHMLARPFRTEIGILRALGTSSRGVLLMFLGEASILGLLGSALGIGLGRLLAGAIVGCLAQGLDPFDAAVAAAYIHGYAVELAAEFIGT